MKKLINLTEPILNQHHKLLPSDKRIWDKSYEEEYQGLVKLDTWELISESDYNLLRKTLGPTLPTIAISTIKKDSAGNTERAKYRICVLGNLDPHNWTKTECFPPVLSAVELRFLVNLAVKKKCIPKSGDASQAFCEAYLPESEKIYLCHPLGIY